MKKIIRQGAFETNSSSSHSLIIKRKEESSLNTFPRNSDKVFSLSEYGVSNGHEEYPDIYKLTSEVSKARFMLNFIATYIEFNLEEYPDVGYWRDEEQTIKNENRTFSILIQQTPFVWFKELLEEATETKFVFVEPSYGCFPYYDAIYGDEEIAEEFLVDFKDKDKFKNAIKNIVFNEDVVIIDADIPYGHEEILNNI